MTVLVVSIVRDDWCWKNKSLELEVLEEDVSGIEFRQTGYMLRCSLSHAITLVGASGNYAQCVWRGSHPGCLSPLETRQTSLGGHLLPAKRVNMYQSFCLVF